MCKHLRARAADFRFPELAVCRCIFPVERRGHGGGQTRLLCWRGRVAQKSVLGEVRGHSGLEVRMETQASTTSPESVRSSHARSKLKRVFSGCLAPRSCPCARSCLWSHLRRWFGCVGFIRYPVGLRFTCLWSNLNVGEKEDKVLPLMSLKYILTLSSPSSPIILNQHQMFMQWLPRLLHTVFSHIPFLEPFDW